MKLDFNAPKAYEAPSFGDKDLVPLDGTMDRRIKRPIIVGSAVVGVFVAKGKDGVRAAGGTPISSSVSRRAVMASVSGGS